MLIWKEGFLNIAGPDLNEPFLELRKKGSYWHRSLHEWSLLSFWDLLLIVMEEKNGQIVGVEFIQWKMEIHVNTPPSQVMWLFCRLAGIRAVCSHFCFTVTLELCRCGRFSCTDETVGCFLPQLARFIPITHGTRHSGGRSTSFTL